MIINVKDLPTLEFKGISSFGIFKIPVSSETDKKKVKYLLGKRVAEPDTPMHWIVKSAVENELETVDCVCIRVCGGLPAPAASPRAFSDSVFVIPLPPSAKPEAVFELYKHAIPLSALLDYEVYVQYSGILRERVLEEFLSTNLSMEEQKALTEDFQGTLLAWSKDQLDKYVKTQREPHLTGMADTLDKVCMERAESMWRDYTG